MQLIPNTTRVSTLQVLDDCLAMSPDATAASLVTSVSRSLMQQGLLQQPTSVQAQAMCAAGSEANGVACSFPHWPGPAHLAVLLWVGNSVAGLALLGLHGPSIAQLLHLSCGVHWQAQCLQEQLLAAVEAQLSELGVAYSSALVPEAVLAAAVPDSAEDGRLVIRLRTPARKPKALNREARCSSGATALDGSFQPGKAVPASWPLEAGYVEVGASQLRELACFHLARLPAARVVVKALGGAGQQYAELPEEGRVVEEVGGGFVEDGGGGREEWGAMEDGGAGQSAGRGIEEEGRGHSLWYPAEGRDDRRGEHRVAGDTAKRQAAAEGGVAVEGHGLEPRRGAQASAKGDEAGASWVDVGADGGRWVEEEAAPLPRRRRKLWQPEDSSPGLSANATASQGGSGQRRLAAGAAALSRAREVGRAGGRGGLRA